MRRRIWSKRALFEAGKLAAVRIDWRAAYAHYARAARLQPSNWQYAQYAGLLAHAMGDYGTAVSFNEAVLSRLNSEFGPEHSETAIALNNLAHTYQSLARYSEAEPLIRRAIEIGEKTLGKDHPDVATRYNNLALLLSAQRKYDEAEPLYRRAIEIGEKALGNDHPNVALPVLRQTGSQLLYNPRYKAGMTKPNRSFGGPSRSVKRRSARIILPLQSATTTLPICFKRGGSMIRPSRSIAGPSRSVKRRSAMIILSFQPTTTTSRSCFRPSAGMMRPSRSIAGPSR